MISDDKIRTISLFLSIIGLLALAFLSFIIEPEKVEISEIDRKMVGHYVSTSGKVVNKPILKDSGIFFTITDGKKSIKVVIFSRYFPEELVISKNDEVEVIGKIQEYKGKLEIVGKKVNIVG